MDVWKSIRVGIMSAKTKNILNYITEFAHLSWSGSSLDSLHGRNRWGASLWVDWALTGSLRENTRHIIWLSCCLRDQINGTIHIV